MRATATGATAKMWRIRSATKIARRSVGHDKATLQGDHAVGI
jgi:hypothetical protein